MTIFRHHLIHYHNFFSIVFNIWSGLQLKSFKEIFKKYESYLFCFILYLITIPNSKGFFLLNYLLKNFLNYRSKHPNLNEILLRSPFFNFLDCLITYSWSISLHAQLLFFWQYYPIILKILPPCSKILFENKLKMPIWSLIRATRRLIVLTTRS